MTSRAHGDFKTRLKSVDDVGNLYIDDLGRTQSPVLRAHILRRLVNLCQTAYDEFAPRDISAAGVRNLDQIARVARALADAEEARASRIPRAHIDDDIERDFGPLLDELSGVAVDEPTKLHEVFARLDTLARLELRHGAGAFIQCLAIAHKQP